MSAVVCSKRSSDFVAIQVASIPAIPHFDRTLYLQSPSGPELFGFSIRAELERPTTIPRTTLPGVRGSPISCWS